MTIVAKYLPFPYELDDDMDDEVEDDDDLDEDDELDDEDSEEDDDEDDDEDVETWQVTGNGTFPLKFRLSLTSGIEVPRLARTFQLS